MRTPARTPAERRGHDRERGGQEDPLNARTRAFERRREHGLTVLVVTQAVLLFFVGPLLVDSGIPRLAGALLVIAVIALMLCLVLTVVWQNRRAAGAVFAATGLEVLASALRIVRPSELTETLDFVAALLFFSALSVVLGTVVFGPGRVTVHRVLGAIAIYLNVAFAFALGYRLIAVLASGAFSARVTPAAGYRLFDFVYFSLSTLTTSGYGDIVPVAPLARVGSKSRGGHRPTLPCDAPRASRHARTRDATCSALAPPTRSRTRRRIARS